MEGHSPNQSWVSGNTTNWFDKKLALKKELGSEKSAFGTKRTSNPTQSWIIFQQIESDLLHLSHAETVNIHSHFSLKNATH